MANKPHHADPTFRRASAAIRARANRDPGTTCWRCGLTLAQRRATHPRAVWHCGHLVTGDIRGGLAAECSVCNCRDGQRVKTEREKVDANPRW